MNEIEIISVSFYSKNLEFLKNNATALYKSFFQSIKVHTLEEIKNIVY